MSNQRQKFGGHSAPLDIELCAGMGGLTLGLHGAGFGKTNGSRVFEINSDALKSLRLNRNQGPLHCKISDKDIKTINWRQELSGQPVRLLAAGPPCTPFSNAGKRKGREDPRDLFPAVIRAVRELKPQAVLVENVFGLAGPAQREYFDHLLMSFRHPSVVRKKGEEWADFVRRLARKDSGKKSGEYRVWAEVLNAADYGVAQVRRRLFIVCLRADIGADFAFPTPTHSKNANKFAPWQTTADALAGLGNPVRRADGDFGHYRIPGARTYAGHTGSRLSSPAKTLKSGVNGNPGGENTVIARNGRIRYFTLREMARLQGFPDSYKLRGARSVLVRQLGNAVPPLLAKAVGRQVKKALGKRLKK